MICPSCIQIASSFLRNTFSMQGVTFCQSVKGYFKCQHCGILLRAASFGKELWFLLGAMCIVLIILAEFFGHLLSLIGSAAIAVYWVALAFLFISVFVYGAWRFSRAEKVDIDLPKTATS